MQLLAGSRAFHDSAAVAVLEPKNVAAGLDQAFAKVMEALVPWAHHVASAIPRAEAGGP